MARVDVTTAPGRGHRDLVVVGASAGGVEALRTLAAGLPADFPAAVLVTLHVPASSPSALPLILSRAGRLPARHGLPDQPLRPGEIVVAPPNRHLLVYDTHHTLSLGPRENGHRPAIDVLFRSAARSLGSRVIGVVLSGSLDDGSAGLIAVRSRGGLGVVQDPGDALHDSMPTNAIRAARPEHVLPVADIPPLLSALVDEEIVVSEAPGPSRLMQLEADMADLDPRALNELPRPGEPSGLSCPDCGGSLFTIFEGGLSRFRCRVGHAWSPESLVAQQATAVESALWMALRSLEERAALTGDMADRAENGGHEIVADTLRIDQREAQAAALLVRDLINELTENEAGTSQSTAGSTTVE